MLQYKNHEKTLISLFKVFFVILLLVDKISFDLTFLSPCKTPSCKNNTFGRLFTESSGNMLSNTQI